MEMQQLSNWLKYKYAHREGEVIGEKLNNYEFKLTPHSILADLQTLYFQIIFCKLNFCMF